MGASLGQIADSIVTTVKGRLGAAWDGLGPDGQQLLVDCANDAAALQVEALAAGAADPAAADRLAAEKRQIDAQLANLQAAGTSAVTDAFWAGVLDVFHTALGLAIKVALA